MTKLWAILDIVESFTLHLTHWLLELFAKNASLDILMVLRLDLGQSSFNLVKNTFATQQLALLATRIAFYDILAQACAEIKFWNSFWQEGDLHL